MMFVFVPFSRSAIGIFKSSLAASGWPSRSRNIPGRIRISSALLVSNPPVVSVDEPLRITIKSRGSPEILRLCSKPSTRPNRIHDDHTTKPVPMTVISVVFHRTRKLRTLYLSGIMGASDDPPQPVNDREIGRSNGRIKTTGETDENRNSQALERDVPGDVVERKKTACESREIDPIAES